MLTLLLLVLVCIARASLFTQYCPLIEDLELGEADGDGIPRYIGLTLRRWKGNADGRMALRLHMRRNYMHLEYCPSSTSSSG